MGHPKGHSGQRARRQRTRLDLAGAPVPAPLLPLSRSREIALPGLAPGHGKPHRAAVARLLPAAAARLQYHSGFLPPPRLPQPGQRRLDGLSLRARAWPRGRARGNAVPHQQ